MCPSAIHRSNTCIITHDFTSRMATKACVPADLHKDSAATTMASSSLKLCTRDASWPWSNVIPSEGEAALPSELDLSSAAHTACCPNNWSACLLNLQGTPAVTDWEGAVPVPDRTVCNFHSTTAAQIDLRRTAALPHHLQLTQPPGLLTLTTFNASLCCTLQRPRQPACKAAAHHAKHTDSQSNYPQTHFATA